jgi:hypothetical protein
MEMRGLSGLLDYILTGSWVCLRGEAIVDDNGIGF